MDVLDKYKKAWGNQPEESSKLSSKEIYNLAHSKSSSIVKWIFIIGILEFLILNSLYFFVDMDEAYKEYEKLGLANFLFYIEVAVYPVIIYFLVKFYLNYKRISTIDSTKILMKKILKTRKTVRNYVFFNLGYIALITIVVIIASIGNNTKFDALSNKQLLLTVFLTITFMCIFLGIIWLFYQLIYGILLKKLNKNYKELIKLDKS